MIYLAILTFVFVIFAFCFLYFWGINPGDMTVFFTAGFFGAPSGFFVTMHTSPLKS